MAILRDTVEIMGPMCQMLINQQGDQVVFSVEVWSDDPDRRLWARLDLDPKDAVRLASFLETSANEARKVQDEIRKEMEPK